MIIDDLGSWCRCAFKDNPGTSGRQSEHPIFKVPDDDFGLGVAGLLKGFMLPLSYANPIASNILQPIMVDLDQFIALHMPQDVAEAVNGSCWHRFAAAGELVAKMTIRTS